MLNKVIKFFKEDFWNFMWSLPKCKNGGYCNQNKEEYYINEIKTERNYTIVYGYKYYCTKCDKDTSEYGKL